MRMLIALVDLKLGHKNAAEAILGDHAANGVRNELFRSFGPNFGDGAKPFATLPTGIAHELLLGLFLAGDGYLFGIDDNHEIARIEVRSEDGLVLSPENICDLDGQTAQNSAIGINHMPLALLQIDFRQVSFH